MLTTEGTKKRGDEMTNGNARLARLHVQGPQVWPRIRRLVLWCGALAVLLLPILPVSPAQARKAKPKPPPACYLAFPGAHSKSIGRTVLYNRQSSVQSVACFHFGLTPSADFPVSADMVCGLLAQAIGVPAENLGLFADGACSGAALAADPKEPTAYIGTACSWASDLLGKLNKPGGALASAGCTLAPSAGTFLSGVFESKHELDVARDIEDRGMCLKYSPHHFGSPWLAVKCSKGDSGFTQLAKYWNRSCSSAGGAVDGMNTAVVENPVDVSMRSSTAADIARRIGPGEFGKPGPTANETVCFVGQMVSIALMGAWDRSGPVSQPFVVGVEVHAYGNSPYIGQFICEEAPSPAYPWHVTCSHKSDRNSGAITARLIVQSNVD